jgi:hypothetical protein
MTQPTNARNLLSSAVDRTKQVRDAIREESGRIAEEREAERQQAEQQEQAE